MTGDTEHPSANVADLVIGFRRSVARIDPDSRVHMALWAFVRDVLDKVNDTTVRTGIFDFADGRAWAEIYRGQERLAMIQPMPAPYVDRAYIDILGTNDIVVLDYFDPFRSESVRRIADLVTAILAWDSAS